METSPTREEFESLKKSHQNLIDSLASVATADFALSIAVIGHLAAHASNHSENIESIGQSALSLLDSIESNKSIPDGLKAAMINRIGEIIKTAQRRYG
ncbi:hypothetical protein RJO15_07860 [Herbaspirillum huttiense F1]|uniref:hypothetical protein n=1 Tax=Herbaspirillum huttiense TaxID=863372 RepID=UPI002886C190|nr:hypothetical protein [Herbaspirillum huttiense]MDT0355675.1 hypothetical protein [Herbaspirillum huttiense F1]